MEEYLAQKPAAIILVRCGRLDSGSMMMPCGYCSNEGGAVYAMEGRWMFRRSSD